MRRAGIALAREVERRAPRRGDHVVVERGTRRAHLHRLQPERPRPHHRVGVLGAAHPDRDRVDAVDVGRSWQAPNPTTTRWRPCPPWCRPRRPVGRHGSVAQSIAPLLEMVDADEERGLGDMPYPPNYPKMPGEPQTRVQPSTGYGSDRGKISGRLRPVCWSAGDVSRNTPPAKASRISARAIHVDSTDVGIRDLRSIRANRSALRQPACRGAEAWIDWDRPA